MKKTPLRSASRGDQLRFATLLVPFAFLAGFLVAPCPTAWATATEVTAKQAKAALAQANVQAASSVGQTPLPVSSLAITETDATEGGEPDHLAEYWQQDNSEGIRIDLRALNEVLKDALPVEADVLTSVLKVILVHEYRHRANHGLGDLDQDPEADGATVCAHLGIYFEEMKGYCALACEYRERELSADGQFEAKKWARARTAACRMFCATLAALAEFPDTLAYCCANYVPQIPELGIPKAGSTFAPAGEDALGTSCSVENPLGWVACACCPPCL